MIDNDQDPQVEKTNPEEQISENLEESSINEAQVEQIGWLKYINPLPFLLNVYTQYKWLTLIGGGALILLISAVLTYFIYASFFMHKKETLDETIQYSTNYYPLPELKLRIKHDDDTFGYLVIGLTLKLPGEAKIDEYRKMEPEILDLLHTYLSSIMLEDFSASPTASFTSPVGLERLRLNIIRRLNTILAPLVIESVLFRKLITQ